MVKLYQGHNFIQWIGPPWLVERLAEFDLGLYAQFIAVCQIVIRIMLLTTRNKLLGGIMLIPMILNILLVIISQNWRGTPYVLAVLLMLNLVLLFQFRAFFKPILNESLIFSSPTMKSEKNGLAILIWLVGLCLFSVQISYFNFPMAYLMAGLGVVFGFLFFWID